MTEDRLVSALSMMSSWWWWCSASKGGWMAKIIWIRFFLGDGTNQSLDSFGKSESVVFSRSNVWGCKKDIRWRVTECQLLRSRVAFEPRMTFLQEDP